MQKAIDVAAELRNLADHIEKGGYTFIETPLIYFSYRYGGDDAKDSFIAFSKLLPRPIRKEYDSRDLTLKYETPAMRIYSTIERSKVCRVVEPAKDAVYECEPLLSADEESELEA